MFRVRAERFVGSLARGTIPAAVVGARDDHASLYAAHLHTTAPTSQGLACSDPILLSSRGRQDFKNLTLSCSKPLREGCRFPPAELSFCPFDEIAGNWYCGGRRR